MKRGVSPGLGYFAIVHNSLEVSPERYAWDYRSRTRIAGQANRRGGLFAEAGRSLYIRRKALLSRTQGEFPKKKFKRYISLDMVAEPWHIFLNPKLHNNCTSTGAQ